MRVLILVVVAGCTIGNAGRQNVTAPPPPDPDRMPSAVLEKQDPGADTSKNPELSRSEAHYVDTDSLPTYAGCLRLLACDSGPAGEEGGATLIVLAVLAATRRRNRS